MITAIEETSRTRNPKPAGYEFFTDSETGKTLATDMRTGEIVETCTLTVPVGSNLITPQEQERNRAYKERAATYAGRRLQRSDGNKYFFTAQKETFSPISPESVARLIYLCSFLGYETGALRLTERSPISKKDLPKILGLSKRTVDHFLLEAADYIWEDNDHNIIVDDTIFYRGKLSRTNYSPFQVLYIDTVRSLYTNTPSSQHRKLGYIFKMLPYLNFEYNILCHNPEETSLDKILPMTVAEFCDTSGYDLRKASRLRREYSRITFDIDGEREHFCMFVYDGVNTQNARIIINPKVIYNGSHMADVQVLATYFKPVAGE